MDSTRHMTLTDKLNAQASANVDLAGQAILRAHEEGYDANYDGAPIRSNPYSTGTPHRSAWKTGYLQARANRAECELCDRERERAQQADWLDGADLS